MQYLHIIQIQKQEQEIYLPSQRNINMGTRNAEMQGCEGERA